MVLDYVSQSIAIPHQLIKKSPEHIIQQKQMLMVLDYASPSIIISQPLLALSYYYAILYICSLGTGDDLSCYPEDHLPLTLITYLNFKVKPIR